MLSRRALPFALLCALAIALAGPVALADDQAVSALAENAFSPDQVALKPGEKVNFTNTGGEHNVVWNDSGAAAQPPAPAEPGGWPAGGVTRTFAKAGRYRYYCANHGDKTVDAGMFGYVHVNVAGLIPPSVKGLSVTANRSGLTLKFRASKAGRAKATLARIVKVRRGVPVLGPKTSISFSARAGRQSKHVARALAKGRYSVSLVVTADRVKSDAAVKTFRVS